MAPEDGTPLPSHQAPFKMKYVMAAKPIRNARIMTAFFSSSKESSFLLAPELLFAM